MNLLQQLYDELHGMGFRATAETKEKMRLTAGPGNHGDPKYQKETLGSFKARHRCSYEHISRRLNAVDCPEYQYSRGPGGRLRWLISNDALEEFMRKMGTK